MNLYLMFPKYGGCIGVLALHILVRRISLLNVATR